MKKNTPTITPTGFFVIVVMGLLGMVIHAKAADYRYQYQEPLQYRPVQSQPVPQNYMAASPTQNQTVIVNAPQPEVVIVQQPRHRYWNPIGAIMAVPRAALAVPGAILGGDDDYAGDGYE